MRLHLVLLVLIAPVFLSGCWSDDLPFLNSANYKMEGIETDKATQDYLQKIMTERLAAEKPEAENEAEKQQYENYQEKMINGSLLKALQAKGFYDARVEYRDAQEPLTGTYKITAGEAYIISGIIIRPENFSGLINNILIKEGDIVEAEKVLAAEETLYNIIQKDKCYFSLKVAHEAILDQDKKSATVIFNIDAGPQAAFGEVVFEGQESVKVSYLKKLIPFKDGDCFRREKIADLRKKLLSTGLFSRAEIVLPETLPADNIVTIPVSLKERAQRTLRAGLSYYTDEGPGAVFGWEHRNFLGAAEKLEASLKISQLDQSLKLDLTKPFFFRKDQSLSLSSSIQRQDTEAFEELSIGAGAGVSQSFGKYLSGKTGMELKLLRVEDKNDGEKENFGLLSFPNSLTFDNRDDKLDPYKGWELKGTFKPYIDVLGTSDPFYKTRFYATTYFGFQKNTVLAVTANAGTIGGADIDSIPASERFYAGGGGSVRGFGYQEVGPFTNGDPSGGASIVEGATELRFKITDTIGAVAFVDAASVSEEQMPQFNDFSIGAGVGLRYFTSFGPLRLDVATPLANDENTDSNYQIYISIGQAF